MTNLIAEITKALTAVQGNQFVSLTYLSKSSGELARHTINVGFSYHNAVVKSVTELEILISENMEKWNVDYKAAAEKIMASLKKTLAAHERGEQNEDYTKRGQYIPIAAGVNVNTADNTIQLFGLSHTKTVLIQGIFPKVNSSAVTLARRSIEKQLTVGKFREFALDLSQIAQVKVNGNTLEMEPVLV